MNETKPCQCGKKMVLVETGIALLSLPPKYQQNWTCFGCGAKEPGPTYTHTHKSADQLAREKWEDANK